MSDAHPARTARTVTGGLSVAAAMGIVAALADGGGGDPPDAVPSTVQVVIPAGVDDETAREAVRRWLERGGEPPEEPVVLRDTDRPDATTQGS